MMILFGSLSIISWITFVILILGPEDNLEAANHHNNEYVRTTKNLENFFVIKDEKVEQQEPSTIRDSQDVLGKFNDDTISIDVLLSVLGIDGLAGEKSD